MLVKIEKLLNADEVAHCRRTLESASWIDGRATAGSLAAKAKDNLQLPADDPRSRELGELILGALGRNQTFFSAALPLRVLPPMFNRYDVGMRYDAHVDNAIRQVGQPNQRLRADVSSTLFLTPPQDYDGGELVIEDTYGEHEAKLEAGDLIVYPASSLHRVAPVTRGSRWAAFFWTQSMVRDDGQRAQLYDLDLSVRAVRAALSDTHPAAKSLTATYHNLLRRWGEM
jgi:PKHD-type hydroxylase